MFPLLFPVLNLIMSSFRSDPFLWIHLSGIVALPLFLIVVWLGLGFDRYSSIELLIVVIVGILPVLWMQLVRPFNIFSILVVSLKPEQLTTKQRQILALFQSKRQKILSLFAAAFIGLIFWQIYNHASLAISFNPLVASGKLVNLAIASLAFLFSNLFLQVPISVLGILFYNSEQLAATEPVSVAQVSGEFTSVGFQVNQILPTVLTEKNQESI